MRLLNQNIAQQANKEYDEVGKYFDAAKSDSFRSTHKRAIHR